MRSLLLPLLFLASAGAGGADTTLYVSPAGKDGAAGTRQAPLATLAGARDRVRQLGAGKGAVTVLFAAGTYRMEGPVAFGEQDSGTPAAPIAYRAAPGAVVRLTGGVSVAGWAPVKDEAVLKRLAPEARGKVMVADLRAQGITDYGKLAVRGFAMGSPPAEAELFYNDEPMTLARWPNTGFEGIKRKVNDQQVEVNTDRLSRWTEESDPWIFAYWHFDWAEIYEPIAGIDAANHILTRSDKVKPQYGITAGPARWYALNLLSELDTPGEYYLDRTNGKLYFWPPKAGGAAMLSEAGALIEANSLSHVTFRGFTLEGCRGTAVTLKGGTDCHVVGCTIRNVGHQAVSVQGGTKHEVYGCDVYNCGEGGISMSGGDRATLTPAGHNAENNWVHDYSRRARTYKTAINVYGVGNRIAHNLVHDGPHMALSAGGNDNVVEYNEIHNVVYESGDAGAFYVGRDWTQRGNVIRYNYFHHIVGGTGYGGMTIYLDDQFSSETIFGNLFERCSQAVFIGGGCDNVVTNNVFIDCWKAAHLDNRGMGWQKKATDDPNGELRTRLRAMPYQNDLWKQRFPALVNILNDDPGVPKRNVFTRNISAGNIFDDINNSIRKYQTVEDNLAFDGDKEWIRLTKDKDGRPVKLTFKDPAAVAKIGFQPLPLEKMGLYADPRRASWPVRNVTREIKLPEPGKPKPEAKLAPGPVYAVPRSTAAVTVDGRLEPTEWAGLAPGKAITLGVEYKGAAVQPPAHAWISHDGTALRVAISSPLPAKRDLGSTWGQCEAVELAFRAADGANADTMVLRGYAGGKWEAMLAAGSNADVLARLKTGVQYAAKVAAGEWTAEWSIPLKSLGVVPGDRLRCNVTLRRTEGDLWIMWRPTHGDSYLVDKAGTLELGR